MTTSSKTGACPIQVPEIIETYKNIFTFLLVGSNTICEQLRIARPIIWSILFK